MPPRPRNERRILRHSNRTAARPEARWGRGRSTPPVSERLEVQRRAPAGPVGCRRGVPLLACTAASARQARAGSGGVRRQLSMPGMHIRRITAWAMALSLLFGGAVAPAAAPSPKAPAQRRESLAWPEHRPRVEISATSRFGDDGTFAPWRVVDGWASSLWCEGARGDGLNQALTFKFDVPQRFARIEVQGGAMASTEHFLANDVPIGWELRTDTGVRLHAKDSA